MKTTIELPDDLYRRAKAKAALQGRKVKDLVEEGLRLVVEEPIEPVKQPTLLELMEDAIGVFDSGVPDLATNPKYMEGLGEDGGRNR